jgi:DNA-binding NarL/FixJ family response regulator
VAPTREAAVVVDSWPLIRAGISQLLADQGMMVLAEGAAAAQAVGGVTGPVNLVVLGSTTEPLLDDVDRVRRLPGPEGAAAPNIVVLLDRVDATELRALLTRDVGGILNRTIGMEELGQACTTVMAGQRVLSNAAMSVLASGGLDLTEPDADTGAQAGVLTPKEREVLAQLAQHRSNAEIATALHVSAATVKTHLSNIYGKLGVKGRRQAVVAAAERGLLA